MPSQLQSLAPLEGYLNIADGSLPAKVMVEPRSYPKQAERLIADPNAIDAQPSGKTADSVADGGGKKKARSLKEFKVQQSAQQSVQRNGFDKKQEHQRGMSF